MSDKDLKTCGKCGASVYPEHLEAGKAADVDGRVYCSFCYAEYQESHDTQSPRTVGQTTMRAPGETDDLTPLAVDDLTTPGSTSASMRSIGGETFAEAAGQQDDSNLKRQTLTEGSGATRCRTFHAKLNDGAVSFLNKSVNDWADQNTHVVIKFATSTIGVWEGKKADPHLIVTVFY
jgi:hypothetical protein